MGGSIGWSEKVYGVLICLESEADACIIGEVGDTGSAVLSEHPHSTHATPDTSRRTNDRSFMALPFRRLFEVGLLHNKHLS